MKHENLQVRAPEEIGLFPLQLICDSDEFPMEHWLSANREELNGELTKYGAILLKGFPVSSMDDFRNLNQLLFGDPISYSFRTSPRTELGQKVYTSTVHPADQVIEMHTENSYAPVWNRIISFYCEKPALSGGETPLADERKLVNYIDAGILEKFRQKGVLYVRNSMPGMGLGWRDIYQTDVKQVAEKYLSEHNIKFSWVTNEHLRTEWILPAFRKHPETGREVWFNHMYFGHKSHYDPVVLEFIDEASLPFLTCYGDGTEIETDVIQAFKNAYAACKIEFPWKKGEVLLLDNMLFSHGRNSFKGERTILTVMSKGMSDVY